MLSLALFLAALTSRAAVPAPEKLLPEDTLVVVTAPDFSKLSAVWQSLPQLQFWNEPAMKPFRDKFVSKWQEDFVKPLERDLSIKCENYTSLAQGQVTFAVTQNGWQGGDSEALGILLLLDTKDKSTQLKTNLADLRKKWVDAGKNLKTEKIRDFEFTVFPLSSNDVPKTLHKFFPSSSPVQELGDETQPKKPAPKSELVLGQVESLLIIGNSTKVVERVVARFTGGSLPALGEQAAFQANYQALFRDAPFYAWVNTKTFIDLFMRMASDKKENPDAPNPFDIKPEKILAALGVASLKTIALSFQNSNEGASLQVLLGVPEASRQGIFKILAGEAKEVSPPPFVPADAVKFQRWRLDGQKAWATLEKMMMEISPQGIGGLNFILDSANARAKEKEPGFDIRKNLIGNLGDDIISYQKSPRGTSPADLQAQSSLWLLGSPKPEVMVGALKGLFVIFPQGEAVVEREFLGRKIYSLQLPSLPMFSLGGTGKAAAPATLNFAASSGYVGLSTDASLLEQFLRSSDTQGKALRETAGLADAEAKVTGTGTSLFGYENEAETMRVAFEALKKDSSASGGAAAFLPTLGIPGAEQGFKEWLDFSLLPSFDKVAKYFYFSVYGGSANVDGLMFKMFAPVPPSLKAGGTSGGK